MRNLTPEHIQQLLADGALNEQASLIAEAYLVQADENLRLRTALRAVDEAYNRRIIIAADETGFAVLLDARAAYQKG
ncbi:hypothetical protein F8S09_02020 [Deinococcus sp. SDU3-2]|uniref:Uncharacterized protein n=1 Tax=Deinococcus terrestris TaxID=2651870 RepID=A0A7X1TQN4_9DEIO|nr:hypothetical protein [Deinococcus terrestris]MPY65469.1 hypothetical protein [Deinococcus terrestris]